MSGSDLQSITIGGGCFWCIEAAYSMTTGVISAVSGYMGGKEPNPTYKQVCSGQSGYVEVVQITFNPREISLPQLLFMFFNLHDPTQLNRQGNDIGSQYRSVIYYDNEKQKEISKQIILELTEQEIWQTPIVTSVERGSVFYPAEDYHQEYFRQNKQQPYCAYVIEPKLDKFKKQFKDVITDD